MRKIIAALEVSLDGFGEGPIGKMWNHPLDITRYPRRYRRVTLGSMGGSLRLAQKNGVDRQNPDTNKHEDLSAA
jgi:hypothetical protein